MRMRFLHISTALAMLVAMLSCGGADSLAPATSDSTLLAGLTASGPVASASIGSNGNAINASVGPNAEVSWVSLVPGTVPDGVTATIVNRRTAQSLTTAIVDGGFDPQPIAASVGDTIQVSVSRVGKPDAGALLSVARPAPLRIVRTRPMRGQTDAPLNTIIAVVFSEPLAAASVNPTTIALTTGGAWVAGAVRVVPGPGYAVEFVPAALLAPSTTYTLTMSGVVNLAGTPLAAPISIPFTTTARAPTLLADSVKLSFEDVMVTGDTIQIRGYVYRGQGESMEALEWTVSDPSVASIRLLDTNLIEVRALRSGPVTISARAPGSRRELSARASLTVFARSSQPTRIVVDDFSVLELTFADPIFAYAPNLWLRDTSATGFARVIGITIDLPGAANRLYCTPTLVLGTGSLSVFPPPGGGYVLWRDQALRRLPDLAVDAMAHVTALLSDGLGVSFTVTGKVVPNFSSWDYTSTGPSTPCKYLAPR